MTSLKIIPNSEL